MFQKSKKQTPTISQLDSAPISTVLASDIIIKGDISGEQTIKIDGQVIGNIQVSNGIIIGEKAVITGDLKSENIIVHGSITGTISCNELIIKSSGNVNGEINTHNIEIEMGGRYNGLLNMQVDSASTKKEKAIAE